MIYIYQKKKRDNLILERLDRNQVILRSEKNNIKLPLVKCSDAELSFIFSNTDGFIHNHVSRLEWKDTRTIITDILDLELDNGEHTIEYNSNIPYKPSSNINYRIQIIRDLKHKKVNIYTQTKYTVWQINRENGKVTDISTPIIQKEFRLSYEEYSRLLTGIILREETVADDIMNNIGYTDEEDEECLCDHECCDDDNKNTNEDIENGDSDGDDDDMEEKGGDEKNIIDNSEGE